MGVLRLVIEGLWHVARDPIIARGPEPSGQVSNLEGVQAATPPSHLHVALQKNTTLPMAEITFLLLLPQCTKL